MSYECHVCGKDPCAGRFPDCPTRRMEPYRALEAQRDEARSQADALAEALERMTVTAPDIIVAQEIARSALALHRSSSSTETEDRA